MAVHVKALTYQPKIGRVLSGEIRQTIRKVGKKPIKHGDTLILHGWFGRPYRSPWSWRIKLNVWYVKPLLWTGHYFVNQHGRLSKEEHEKIFKEDGFSSLSDGLDFFSQYPRETMMYMIKWDWPPIEECDV